MNWEFVGGSPCVSMGRLDKQGFDSWDYGLQDSASPLFSYYVALYWESETQMRRGSMVQATPIRSSSEVSHVDAFIQFISHDIIC